jgi:TDG/mug DNA glycosylase family protein
VIQPRPPIVRRVSLVGVAPADVPLALAELHLTVEPGDGVEVTGIAWPVPTLADVFEGAGFGVAGMAPVAPGRPVTVVAERLRTLPDTVGPGMRLLVCGLNPSLYSADRGVGYARPGNRFWPAAVEAGLVPRARDPIGALQEGRVGMTDLCKRATTASAELTGDEYRAGAARVERLVRWLQPGAVCFVGLEGWRAAVDRSAAPGVQDRAFGGRPAYVMPSTSGLNAHTKPADHVAHLRAARELADGAGEADEAGGGSPGIAG